ncbi:MAG: transposase family protein [Xenococcaceae cyanobacterium MO_188.B32]|nr:transposase family protein [Xenococcaceae cyanobacterium MO_188.B32]
MEIPHKKPKGGELTEEQKEENRELASERVVCEHAFAGVKRYGIATDVILLANVLQTILHKVLLMIKVKIFRYCNTINFSKDYFRQQYQMYTETGSRTLMTIRCLPPLGCGTSI